MRADRAGRGGSRGGFTDRFGSPAAARALATVALVAALHGSAFAHTGTGLAGGLHSGFVHPLSGFDHLLAMVAVGLWSAFLARRDEPRRQPA